MFYDAFRAANGGKGVAALVAAEVDRVQLFRNLQMVRTNIQLRRREGADTLVPKHSSPIRLLPEYHSVLDIKALSLYKNDYFRELVFSYYNVHFTDKFDKWLHSGYTTS